MSVRFTSRGEAATRTPRRCKRLDQECPGKRGRLIDFIDLHDARRGPDGNRPRTVNRRGPTGRTSSTGDTPASTVATWASIVTNCVAGWKADQRRLARLGGRLGKYVDHVVVDHDRAHDAGAAAGGLGRREQPVVDDHVARDLADARGLAPRGRCARDPPAGRSARPGRSGFPRRTYGRYPEKPSCPSGPVRPPMARSPWATRITSPWSVPLTSTSPRRTSGVWNR